MKIEVDGTLENYWNKFQHITCQDLILGIAAKLSCIIIPWTNYGSVLMLPEFWNDVQFTC